jgi:hypothetical protein
MANDEKSSLALPSDTARLVREGGESGPSVAADRVFDRLKRKYAAMAASTAAECE